MNKILIIILGLYAAQISAAAGTMTISSLPTAANEDMQVCYDSITGKLGNCSASATAKPERIAWVSKNGAGDYDDPIAAMNDLASWCPSPDLSSECILRIGPGVWQLGGTPLIMVTGVDIQGSGIGATELRGDYSQASGRGLVQGADYSSLRDISILNAGSGTFVSAISANNTEFFYLDHVYATTTGSPTFSYGLRLGNELNSSGRTEVFIRDSIFMPRSSGTNTGIRLIGETTESLTAEITSSKIGPFGGNAISVHTTFASSRAKAEVTYSTIMGSVSASGNNSSVALSWSLITSVSNTGSGFITCRFVDASAGVGTNTCP